MDERKVGILRERKLCVAKYKNMRKDSILFLKKLLEYKKKTGKNSFELNYLWFDEIPSIESAIFDILKDLIANNCISSKSQMVDLEGNVIVHLTLDGITYFDEEKEHEPSVIINVSGGQVNVAKDSAKIEAVMHVNEPKGEKGISEATIEKNMIFQGKSNFAERLDVLIGIMNEARMSYEEPITLGYLSEFLGYESENILKQYYMTAQEPNRSFMEIVADKLGVNRLWLSKGANVPIFGDGDREENLSEILLETYKSEKIYFAIGKEGYGNCITIILKLDDIKYKYYRHSFVFHAEGGAGGQNELMEVYEFIKSLRNVKNSSGNYICDEAGFFLKEKEWWALKSGNMYPAAIRKIRTRKACIMDDFLDIYQRCHTYEQYLEWYQSDFVKSQELIKNRLQSEKIEVE